MWRNVLQPAIRALRDGAADNGSMKPRYAAYLALVGRYLMLLGAGCLIIVVLTHVCETFRLFPAMGWGLKHSPGHYLDLGAAALGLAFLPAGYFLAFATDARRPQGKIGQRDRMNLT
jgi:succinate dehydrogenase/fumarate reductase cytochrome b subunit